VCYNINDVEASGQVYIFKNNFIHSNKLIYDLILCRIPLLGQHLYIIEL